MSHLSSSPIPTMLNNFKKKYTSSVAHRSSAREQLSHTESQTEAPVRDLVQNTTNSPAAQHWAAAMVETVCVPGCTCVFCVGRPGAIVGGDLPPTPQRSDTRRRLHRSIPSTDSIMEVLYPASYLGTPGLPDPPAYFPGDSPYPNSTENPQSYPMPIVTQTLITPNHLDPLAEAPPLTGVPSAETAPRRVTLVPSSVPIDVPAVGLGVETLEETEPPPEYSRFDKNRPRFPAASDVLGPYPSIPVLTPAV